MAKANVNIQDVTGFENSISRETDEMYRLSNDVSFKLNETTEKITAEKEKMSEALSKCAEGIARLSIKIEVLNAELEQLRAELAATPPTITVTETDEDGNSYEVEVPNPAYEALLDQIAIVEQKIAELEALKNMFLALQHQGQLQEEQLSRALEELQGLRSDLRDHFQQINNYSDEAVRKLRDIKNILEEYRETKIEAPDLGVFDKENPGSFFGGTSNEETETLPTFETHDNSPDGYLDDRTKGMYDYAEKYYERTDPEWKEAAYRRYKDLRDEKDKYEAELKTLDYTKDFRRRQELQEKISDLNAYIYDIEPYLRNYKSDFVGFGGNTEYDKAYSAFNTDVQGNKNKNIQGDCGIIASQNVVNQQLGIYKTELEAIDHMRSLKDNKGKSLLVEDSDPKENGRTGFWNRKAFVESNGLVLEESGKGRVKLDIMAKRFGDGESIMLRIKGNDLSQKELGSRITYEPNKKTGVEKAIKTKCADHSVTVAGFSKDGNGTITGVYINDTGKWTGSNRVWISAEKFMSMKKNTKNFGVEYCRRKR